MGHCGEEQLPCYEAHRPRLRESIVSDDDAGCQIPRLMVHIGFLCRSIQRYVSYGDAVAIHFFWPPAQRAQA